MPEKEFGATAWGRAWLRTIERTDGPPHPQLPKARSLARNQKAALAIALGTITASVTDGSATHQTNIQLHPWNASQAALAEPLLVHLPSATVVGDLPDSLATTLTKAGAPIAVPLAEIAEGCTCRARTKPCVHVLTTLYALVLLIDERPMTALNLRTGELQPGNDIDENWIALASIRPEAFHTMVDI